MACVLISPEPGFAETTLRLTNKNTSIAVAYDHITANAEMLKPGTRFIELTKNGRLLPKEFCQQRYGVMFHRVGLCDEYPSIRYPEDFSSWV